VGPTTTATPTPTPTPTPSGATPATPTATATATPDGTGATPTPDDPEPTSTATPTATENTPAPGETPTREATPPPDGTATATPEDAPATIFLPYLTRNEPLRETGALHADRPDRVRSMGPGAGPALVASLSDRLPTVRRSRALAARPAIAPSQSTTTTVVVVWREDQTGKIDIELVADDGETIVAPASVGLSEPAPVATTPPGSGGGAAEPEAWILTGSTIFCFGQGRSQGCLTFDD
jgi:hypothetical protein